MLTPQRLRHLRTDRRGIPVPWINLWGPEHPDRLSIKHDPHVRMPAVFLDDTDQTEPDFTRQTMARQRQAMVEGLCQVCGCRIPWSRRYLPVADMSIERIQLDGAAALVVTEPWLDSWCADFAVTHCPALIRRTRDEHLTLVPVTSRRQVSLTVSRGWVDGPLEAESRRVQPAMWVKALLHNVDLRLDEGVTVS